ncbi:MAG: PHP domain-containing protein [Myxococcales bacterium]|nr:PHP domain-containing protein [Myxococcales bacterium]MDP3502829.1 PHP domain-containing protein [Myxococcales bacterium]
MLIDLHVHSYLSRDCPLDPKAVLARAESFGLDGVAFTESNTQDGCDELFDLQRTTKLKVFVGLELATDKGQYLCFFEKPDRAPEPVQLWGSNREKAWSADECLPRLKALGAAIVAARPYDKDLGFPANDYVKTLKLLSAVEVYNPKVRMGANELALEASESMKLPGVAGSDARASLDEIGYAATLFKKPVNTQVELVKALLGTDYVPVQMGALPHLRRPGEAKQEEQQRKKKKKRRWPR